MHTGSPDIFSRSWNTAAAAAYFSALAAADEGYAAAVTAAMERDGVRSSGVSAMEGRLLELFARLAGARKAVEIGTLYGYSAHWLARGLADGGRLYSLERDPACVTAAKDAVEASGLGRRITVIEGPALDTLKTLARLAPFDLVFLDADQERFPDYLRWASECLRPGGLVLANRAFPEGRLAPGDLTAADNARARALREFFHILFDADRFSSASVLPTAEGMAIGLKAA